MARSGADLENPRVAKLDEDRPVGLGEIHPQRVPLEAPIVVRVTDEDDRLRVDLVGEQQLPEELLGAVRDRE